jgi:hypothetical protein
MVQMLGDATHFYDDDDDDDDVEYHKSHVPSPQVESKFTRTATVENISESFFSENFRDWGGVSRKTKTHYEIAT